MMQTFAPASAAIATRRTAAVPVAYIRRSVARRGDPGDVSREFQTAKVRALAGAAGAALRVLDGDWGKSAATDKTAARLDFLGLLDSIERGEVSHVYAYSPDRLARSVEWAARLVNVCRRAGVSITTTAGTVAPDDPAARAMFNMLAVMNETALDEMERKARASAAVVKERGGTPGPRLYGEQRTLRDGTVVGADEDAALILATYREAGSFFAAARLLNDRGVPTRGGGVWVPSTVLRIVNRLDPSTKRHGRKGAAAGSPMHRFAGLLTCHCGATMGRTVSGEGTPRYRCPVGASDPSHSRPYIVPEARLLAAIRAEADHLATPADAVEMVAADEARREALDEKRDGLGDAYAAGAYGPVGSPRAKDALASRLAAIDAEAAAIEARAEVVDLPPAIDWDGWTPEAVNGVLRALFVRVELGADLLPVSFVWAVPEWRA